METTKRLPTPVIRSFKPSLGAPESRALGAAFESGWTGTGIYTRLFESRLAGAVGTGRVLAVNSGTAALHLALKALDVEGGEVVTTPVTSVATAHAVLYNRARPVFCDVEPETGNIDARLLAPLINKRTRAILVVHFGGACDLDAVMDLARRKGLPVVEDACACHPLGGAHRGRPLGTIGTFGTFSFGRFKGLTTVDGGALVFSKEGLRSRLEALRRLGHKSDGEGMAGGPDGVEELGYHFRMNDVAAVIGMTQLQRWEKLSSRLKGLERRYAAGLEGLAWARPPAPRAYSQGVRGPFGVLVPARRRAALRAWLRRGGVQTEDGLTPCHLYKLYRPYRRSLPEAERFCAEWQPLPFYPELKDGEVDRVTDLMKKFS